METRLQMKSVEPEAYKVMLAFEKYLSTTQIKREHKDLLKIRASQLNGCAYCVDMHNKEARHAGEQDQRLYMLPVWREATVYTEEERSVLALTEEVTLISERGVTDETYNHAVALLGEKYVAQIIMAIVAINGWNRIGVSTRMIPGT